MRNFCWSESIRYRWSLNPLKENIFLWYKRKKRITVFPFLISNQWNTEKDKIEFSGRVLANDEGLKFCNTVFILIYQINVFGLVSKDIAYIKANTFESFSLMSRLLYWRRKTCDHTKSLKFNRIVKSNKMNYDRLRWSSRTYRNSSKIEASTYSALYFTWVN